MRNQELIEHAYNFIQAMSLVMPRVMGAFIPLPMFARAAMPNMVRAALVAGLSVMAAVPLMSRLPPMSLGLGLGLAVKEGFLGFTLGYLMALPFWAFEAGPFFIDNQRGASIGATLNPLTGS